MKALILDPDTTGIVSMVFSQSDIIQKSVFLVEEVHKAAKSEDNQSMPHLKGVCYVRPTPSTMTQLCRMLRYPKFSEYHIFFSNAVTKAQLKQLAEADEFGLVAEVQEYFADYFALGEGLFHLGIQSSQRLRAPPSQWRKEEHDLMAEHVAGLSAVLLSLKKRPDVRYEASSSLAKTLALQVTNYMKEEATLFHSEAAQSAPCLLLVLDRNDDPVTPLLSQWTYRAMVHELLGIRNNRLDLHDVPDIRPELQEVVLSPQQDRFYKGSMLLNFGDLGGSMKELVQNYQRKSKDNSNIESIEDMQRFVDHYPEFRQMAGNVSKHVAIMTELSRLVRVRKLMDVSELEQEMVSGDLDHATSLEECLKFLNDQQVRFEEKLRLVMMYALRFESVKNSLRTLQDVLKDRASSPQQTLQCEAVDAVLRSCGADKRGGDLFGNKTFVGMGKRLASQLKGVENVYTQHKPLLTNTLDTLLRGKLKPTNFPFLDSSSSNRTRYKHVIVYIIGGATYEEAAAVEELNQSETGVRIVLGGSVIHNSRSYLADLLAPAR